jgi:hypothetical protein
MTKIAGSGSGSISQRHGSADRDPDPHQNVMDPEHCCRSWGEFLHLALFDLSLKHERRAHALETDLVAHLLASWPLYQLPRFFNTLLPVGGGGGGGHKDAFFLTVSSVLPTFCRIFPPVQKKILPLRKKFCPLVNFSF